MKQFSILILLPILIMILLLLHMLIESFTNGFHKMFTESMRQQCEILIVIATINNRMIIQHVDGRQIRNGTGSEGGRHVKRETSNMRKTEKKEKMTKDKIR